MLYMKEMRAKVVAECTLKESAAINQILGRRWHSLSEKNRPSIMNWQEKRGSFTLSFIRHGLQETTMWVKLTTLGIEAHSCANTPPNHSLGREKERSGRERSNSIRQSQ
ncbi:unnamed protein product, partial [Staurois parvus]